MIFKTLLNQKSILDRILREKPTTRIEKLRDAFLNLSPCASINRVRIETRIMKETEGELLITRRAKVFTAMVREIPIYVFPDQLVVGYSGAKLLCSSVLPDSSQSLLKYNSSYCLGCGLPWRRSREGY